MQWFINTGCTDCVNFSAAPRRERAHHAIELGVEKDGVLRGRLVGMRRHFGHLQASLQHGNPWILRLQTGRLRQLVGCVLQEFVVHAPQSQIEVLVDVCYLDSGAFVLVAFLNAAAYRFHLGVLQADLAVGQVDNVLPGRLGNRAFEDLPVPQQQDCLVGGRGGLGGLYSAGIRPSPSQQRPMAEVDETWRAGRY